MNDPLFFVISVSFDFSLLDVQIRFFWMYPIETIHVITEVMGQQTLEVEVTDKTKKKITYTYSNFVVDKNGVLGKDLCFRDDYNDVFTLMRNSVSRKELVFFFKIQ